MSVAEILSRRAPDLAPAGDFHTVGAPAVLLTNESTPAGFYEGIRSSSSLDGYVIGPGCGNVLAMPEAFAGELLGMVLVDVDPAVVCAGRMLVACMARQATVEGFVREFFCGGEAALRDLEREVLEGEAVAPLRRQMEAQRERLWQALATLTVGFSRGPADVAPLLARWSTFLPPKGGQVPVRAYLAKNYDRLQALARRGDIAVLCCSIFHSGLLAAVASLPRFGGTRHLLYLSNVADHVLRRALLAQAQSRLGLRLQEVAGEPAGRDFLSTEEFVEFLDREQVAQLRTLTAAAAGMVAVDSTARHGLVLRCHDGLPVYAAADFILDFAIDHMVVRFFDSLAGDAKAREEEAAAASPAGSRGGRDGSDGWHQAPLQRAAGLELYSAAVVGDLERARGALQQLRDEAVRAGRAARLDRESESAFLYAAFCVAELACAVLMGRRTVIAGVGGVGGSAGALQPRIEELRGELEVEARLLAASADERWKAGADGATAGAGADSDDAGDGGATATLLLGQMCELTGILLDAPDLRAAGRRWLQAALATQHQELAHAGDGPRPRAVGALAEGVVRWLSCDLHGPRRESIRGVIARGIGQLLQSVGENGQIDGAADSITTDSSAAAAAPSRPAPPLGYEAYFRNADVIYGNVRLALLLYGLSAGEGTPIEAALQVDYFVRHRNLESTPDAHSLLAGIG